jgi:hypothetical protein
MPFLKRLRRWLTPYITLILLLSLLIRFLLSRRWRSSPTYPIGAPPPPEKTGVPSMDRPRQRLHRLIQTSSAEFLENPPTSSVNSPKPETFSRD